MGAFRSGRSLHSVMGLCAVALAALLAAVAPPPRPMTYIYHPPESSLDVLVKSLDDLHKFTYGLGLGWIDVDILKASRFNVVTGSSYDGLFEMLVHKRFDLLLRAAVEVLDEYDRHKEKDLDIEKGIVFYYPLPMYFWFPKTEEGRG